MLSFSRALPCVLLGLVGAAQSGWPQGTDCPSYPVSSRIVADQAITLDRQYSASRKARKNQAAAVIPPSKNFIDDQIFGTMAADGVDAAPLTTDQEFVRRIYLDLTGRVPTFEQAQAFQADSSATKRERIVDTLLASPAFVDQFSHWFLKRFQIVRGVANIGIPERNNFYQFVRQFVAQDRPYDAFVRDVLTATGDSDIEPATALLSRQYSGGPQQDFWDDATVMSTAQFLGITTSCVSCHNGRGHLEKVNLFLTPVVRQRFWQLSAFFSRMRARVVTDDSGAFRRRLIISNSPTGSYNGIVSPSNPGARPARNDANQEPQYWFTGDQPQTGEWRDEWARILTSDPQFARAGANYIWAYFFRYGIVDPPNAWDLARVDPANPPPADWPLQISHPELLAELATRFKDSHYSIRSVIRLIVTSNAYQLSSRYPVGKWQAAYTRYFARHEAQRLSAEQLFDSLATATGTEPLMQVDGMPGIFRYSNQLPHPHSTLDTQVDSLLTSLGQGDWNINPPNDLPSLYGVLDFFNTFAVSARTRAWSDSNSPQSRLATWASSGLSDTDVIRNIFLATLTRVPTDAEMTAILRVKGSDRRMWLTAVQWALVQKSDFIFNY